MRSIPRRIDPPLMGLPNTGTSRAVLIGSSSFEYLEALPAVRNNVAGLKDCLIDDRLWGLRSDNVLEVVDPEGTSDILEPVHAAAEAAADVLLVYYAGHGIVDRRSNLLLAHQASVVTKSWTATPYDHIREIMLESPARRRIVILDCCYSGRALGTMGANVSATAAIVEEADAEGTYVLAAAAENKRALAPPNERYTAFTGELLSLLRDGHPDEAEIWNLDSLYRRLRAGLRAAGRPEPQKRDRNTVGSLPLIRNLAKHVGGPRHAANRTTAQDRGQPATHRSASETLVLRYAARSDRGLVREVNRDSVYAGARLLAVADGVDERPAGEVASQLVVAALAHLDDQPAADLARSLEVAVAEGNDAIAHYGQSVEELKGMATTVTAMLFGGRRLGLVHVGDSPAYLMRDGDLVRITRNASVVPGPRGPAATLHEAATGPQRLLDLRLLTGNATTLHVVTREARAGDRYMLCTRGLSGLVGEDVISEALQIADVAECADRLIELPLRAGGSENISVVVADVVKYRYGV